MDYERVPIACFTRKEQYKEHLVCLPTHIWIV